jgi:glycine/D-amino acid oxidase-like deaminating enzyme
MERIDCLVVGAGALGLAAARALARSGREVIIVERETAIGSGVSARNSEVIHAGIYYPTGLDKTRLCIDGKAMLYDFCRDYSVPHKRCGKLLVATSEKETGKLAAIKAQAEAKGVMDLVWLSGAEARALEPGLVAERALLSPSTGIVDSQLHAGASRRRRAPRGDDRIGEHRSSAAKSMCTGSSLRPAAQARLGLAQGASSMRPGSPPRPLRGPFPECRPTRYRRCTSPRATIFRWRCVRHFRVLPILCRPKAGSACI